MPALPGAPRCAPDPTAFGGAAGTPFPWSSNRCTEVETDLDEAMLKELAEAMSSPWIGTGPQVVRLQGGSGLSEHRACRMVGQHWSTRRRPK